MTDIVRLEAICRELAKAVVHDHEYGQCIFCGERDDTGAPPHSEQCPWQAMLNLLAVQPEGDA